MWWLPISWSGRCCRRSGGLRRSRCWRCWQRERRPARREAVAVSLARYLRQGQPQQKIRPEHLDRAAVVYVRQSSRQQVLEHSESTRLQYALAERAVALGWARSQVVVIDDDLGVSAATADSRKGFARLVTEVTMGRAGVVLGIEMSRLARTGKDWHHLLELCSLSGTLLADPDAVYDPGYYNDRLLLGLSAPA